MNLKQISVFLENKMGRLADITRVLAQAQVNIQAMSIADTNDFGILRLLVDKPDNALSTLRDAGFTVKETYVVGIVLEHKPGGLNNILKQLEENNIFVEYIYDYLTASSPDKATIVVKLENQEEAVEVMRRIGIQMI